MCMGARVSVNVSGCESRSCFSNASMFTHTCKNNFFGSFSSICISSRLTKAFTIATNFHRLRLKIFCVYCIHKVFQFALQLFQEIASSSWACGQYSVCKRKIYSRIEPPANFTNFIISSNCDVTRSPNFVRNHTRIGMMRRLKHTFHSSHVTIVNLFETSETYTHFNWWLAII